MPKSTAGFVDIPLDIFKKAMKDPSVDMLKEVLGGMSWPNDVNRIAPAAAGANRNVPLLRLTLGLTNARHNGPMISRATRDRPRLTKFHDII